MSIEIKRDEAAEPIPPNINDVILQLFVDCFDKAATFVESFLVSDSSEATLRSFARDIAKDATTKAIFEVAMGLVTCKLKAGSYLGLVVVRAKKRAIDARRRLTTSKRGGCKTQEHFDDNIYQKFGKDGAELLRLDCVRDGRREFFENVRLLDPLSQRIILLRRRKYTYLEIRRETGASLGKIAKVLADAETMLRDILRGD